MIMHGISRRRKRAEPFCGSGASFQRFELAQRPLTHRAAPTDVGVKSELVVRVSDVAWEQGATLFGAGARDQRYALETDEQGQQSPKWVEADGMSGDPRAKDIALDLLNRDEIEGNPQDGWERIK